MINNKKITKNQSKQVLASLFAMGAIYNEVIDHLEESGRNVGLTSMLVVVGVAYTVAMATPIIGPKNARFLLAAFIASGSPMIAGNVRRWWRREQRAT